MFHSLIMYSCAPELQQGVIVSPYFLYYIRLYAVRYFIFTFCMTVKVCELRRSILEVSGCLDFSYFMWHYQIHICRTINEIEVKQM